MRRERNRFKQPTAREALLTDRAIKAVREFRAVSHTSTVPHLAMLMRVASKPGLGPTEYGQALGMSQPSASNVLLALGPGKAKPGLGLVTWETDPEDARKQRFTLTEKGRDLVSRVTAHLHGQAAD